MVSNTDRQLLEEIAHTTHTLSVKLYGEGSFVGDIPEIKAIYKNHNKRIRRIEIILAGVLGSGSLTGGIIGLIKWLGE